VYSYTTGECYKSKVNNNIGHDPVSEGSMTPAPPQIEITQKWIPDNLGIPERDEIMVISMLSEVPPPDPADPPPNGSSWVINLVDAVGASLGGAVHISDGVESLSAIATDLASQLDAITGISGSSVGNSITLQASFAFGTAQHTYQAVGSQAQLLKAVVTQTFVATVPPVPGTPELVLISLSTQTTFPGATYTLTITDSTGSQHSVAYSSSVTDSGAQILNGLILAIEASSDTYFEGVQMVIDATLLTLSLSIMDNASVDVVTTVTGSAYWDVVPFPRALADQVIRGAYADLLKEWGQSDKGAMEEQAVPSETTTAEATFDTTPNPALIGQQRALSRYKV